MEHRVRGRLVTLVATDQVDSMLRITKQATVALPGLCTGFSIRLVGPYGWGPVECGMAWY